MLHIEREKPENKLKYYELTEEEQKRITINSLIEFLYQQMNTNKKSGLPASILENEGYPTSAYFGFARYRAQQEAKKNPFENDIKPRDLVWKGDYANELWDGDRLVALFNHQEIESNKQKDENFIAYLGRELAKTEKENVGLISLARMFLEIRPPSETDMRISTSDAKPTKPKIVGMLGKTLKEKFLEYQND